MLTFAELLGHIILDLCQKEPGLNHFIEARNLKHVFKGDVGVKGISLSISPKEAVAVLGPNGSGKSTFIKMLTGQLELQEGQLKLFDGLDFETRRIHILNRIGFAEADPDWPKNSSVAELVDWVSSHYVMWNPLKQEELLRCFGLAMEQKIPNLSRGQKAQLAMVLALSHNPELVVLDEALSGADQATRTLILDILGDVMDDGRRSLLFCTHIPDEVERLATRIICIQDGHISFEGSTEKFLKEMCHGGGIEEGMMAACFPHMNRNEAKSRMELSV